MIPIATPRATCIQTSYHLARVLIEPYFAARAEARSGLALEELHETIKTLKHGLDDLLCAPRAGGPWQHTGARHTQARDGKGHVAAWERAS